MTAWRVARLAVRVTILVVLVVSGAYLILYLYRWEWNRAVVSGLFFLSTLVTISTAMILGALGRLSERIDDLDARAAGTADVRHELRRAGADHARRHFAWLEESASRTSVFIPVLLGAGAILSGFSYLLERLAGALAGASIDRRSAELLAPDLPLGPVPALARTSRPPGPRRAADPLLGDGAPPRVRPRPARALAWAVATVAVVGMVAAAVLTLREVSQSRPEPGTLDGSTVLVVEIEQRRTPRPVVSIAEALWIACRARLHRSTELAGAVAVDERTVRIEVTQGMGPLRERRFVGCLEDTTLDLVQADVVSTRQR